MVLAPWGAVFYTVYGLRSDYYVVPLYLSALLGLFPVALLLRYSAERASNLWVYLGSVALCIPICLGMCELLRRTVFVGWEGLILTGLNGIWVVFLAADDYMIRVAKNRRSLSAQERDPEWKEIKRFTQSPGIPGLVIYLIVYLTGIFFACPSTANIGMVGGIVYLMIAMLRRFISSTDDMLIENRDISRVPAGRIKRIGGKVLMLIASGIIVLSILPLATSRYRYYTDVREWEIEGKKFEQREPDPQEPPVPRSEMDEEINWDDLPQGRPHPFAEAFFNALIKLLAIGGAIGAVVLVRNAIINLFLRFNEKAEDNGDIVMSLDDDEIIKRPGGIRKRVRASGPLTERERIRREYKRRIKESTEDQPNVSNTPTQLEEAAGLADDPEMRELHVKYEDARYSKEE